jgi:ureidoglycolate hydrolase
MLEILKVAVEPLEPEAFAPFGQVISNFDEAKPEVVVGALIENAYTVRAGVKDSTARKLDLSEGRLRAHFAFHDDAGQSFYPSRHCPTVFFVAPVQPMIEPQDLRAFYSDGGTGICMKLKVWHTMPVCLRGEEVYLTARGDQDYHAHSVDVHFDQDRGLALDPDMEYFPGWHG